MKRIMIFVALSSALLVTYCKHTQDSAALEGIGMPDDEGIGVTFTTDLPAAAAHEAIKNFPLLAAASNPDGKRVNIRDLPVRVRCENISANDARCVMSYEGPEMQLNLAQFFFGNMAGTVFVRRGCQSVPCDQDPMKIYWRTYTYKGPSGKTRHDFDVCRIEGLEAGVTVNTPFTFLTKLLNNISYKPEIKGFRSTIEEYTKSAPAFDDFGNPQLDQAGKAVMAPTIDYDVVEGYAGIGPVGPFPTSNCVISDEKTSSPVPTPSSMMAQAGKMPDRALDAAPGRLAKFLGDATHHLGLASARKDLLITLKCQNIKNNPICNVTYQGPEVTIPIPSYVTGIFSSETVFLRNCHNLGCFRPAKAEMTMSTYMKDGLEVFEVCSMKGVEMTNAKKFPLQDRLIGAPDLTGMIMAIKTQGKEPTLSRFRLGVASFGKYPTPRCSFR